MDLEEGYIHASQRISQGYTGMGEGTWIDDYSVDVTAGFVDAIDQGAFPVRLEVVEGYCEGWALFLSLWYYVGESCRTIDMGLASSLVLLAT